MEDLFEPAPTFFSSKIENDHTHEELISYSDSLNKLLSIGTHLLKWEFEDEDVEPLPYDEIIQVGITFRRILEFLDAISIQLRVGSIEPAFAQLRSMFEIFVQFDYLLDSETHKKGHCMLVCDMFRRVERIEKIVEQNRSYEDTESLNHAINVLNSPALITTTEKYKSIRKIIKREIKWYKLIDNKLTTFSDLINNNYTTLLYTYKYIHDEIRNDIIHGTNLLSGNFIIEDGKPGINPIRTLRVCWGIAQSW